MFVEEVNNPQGQRLVVLALKRLHPSIVGFQDGFGLVLIKQASADGDK